MERLQQPFRGFTLAEAVELFRRISAANDDGDRVRDPPRPTGHVPMPPVASEAPSAA